MLKSVNKIFDFIFEVYYYLLGFIIFANQYVFV